MGRILASVTLFAVLLSPALAWADVSPSGGSCRCDVEDQVGQSAVVFAIVGLASLINLRRRRSASASAE